VQGAPDSATPGRGARAVDRSVERTADDIARLHASMSAMRALAWDPRIAIDPAGDIYITGTFATPGADSASAVTYGRNGDVYALVGLGGPINFTMPVIGAASPAAVMLRIAP